MGELNITCEVFNDEYLLAEISSAESIADRVEERVDSRATDVSGFNRIICGSSEDMGEIAAQTVHLIVASPPYCVGKEYETEQSFTDWLILMNKVCSEMRRVLVPEGRVCINVAGIGRNPYRPTHFYVTGIMLELGFLMRGEIVWNKGPSVGVSCAWGSWMSATNPVLRDTHEYVLVFSKGNMKREKSGSDSISRDEFLEATRSVWEIPTESARRIGHHEKYSKTAFNDLTTCRMALDNAVRRGAPILVTSLAAVESGDPVWRDQKNLVHDFINVPNWDYSGFATKVGLPEALTFVYQALHGAICIHTRQLDLAMALANAKVKTIHSQDREMLWTVYELIGWPDTLGHDFGEACQYVISASDRWGWLQDLFGSDLEYRMSLSAYYQALNINECAARLHDSHSHNQLENADLHVPLCFLQGPLGEQEQGFALLQRCGDQVKTLWVYWGVEREAMEAAWPHWLEACRRWRLNVYKGRAVSQMPHRDLFEVL